MTELAIAHKDRAHSPVGGSSAKRADLGRKGLLFDRARTRNETVTYERLKRLLHYNPDSGLFTWLMRTSNRVRVGDIAGCIGKDDGYVRLSIDGVLYLGHRLAWFYMTQEWPPVDADHENRITSDNRWINLRPATRGQNSTNQRKRRVGLKGCYQNPKSGSWIASITHKSLPKGHEYLGSFYTEEEAHEAYCLAAVRLSGEFARFE